MRRRISKRLALALACMALLTMGGCARQDPYADFEKEYYDHEWTYSYKDVADLVRESDLIALVTIGQPKPSYVLSPGAQVTIFPATVEECFYGKGEKEIQLLMYGGVNLEEKIIYEEKGEPLMKEGEEYLIFAGDNGNSIYSVLSGPQGRFVLEDGKVYSLAVANEQVCANYSYDIQVDGMDKADFLEEIAKAIP